MAVTYNLKGTTNSSFKVGKSGNGTVEIGAIDSTGASGSEASITGHLVPSANVTYDLGSTSNYWRDLYLGPGSLYVNGKKVIEDDSGTITFSTDENQNLSISTSGTGQTTLSSVAGLNLTATSSGDITFTTSTGQINFDGDVIVNAAKSISSSNADPITFADPISVTGNSEMANLTITGNLTVQGTTTTIDSTTVQIQNAFKFEGATADDFETTLTVTDPTADRTITLPDATGTVALTSDLTSYVTASSTDTLSNKTLASPTVTGNVAFDTNTLFVDSTNNRVGIGTTSPAVGLDFQMINSGEGFRVRRHNASDQYIEITEGDGSRHEIKANGTKEFRIVNTTAESTQGFHFYRNSAERLRILGDGLITFQDGAGTVAFTNSFTHFHSSAQTVTSGEATTNASGTVGYTFSELSGAIHYMAFLNRTLMRASEYSVSGTTLTVNSGVLATDDQIEVTGISV